MEDLLIEIVKNKTFNELSEIEKQSLKHWCVNEDDFNSLKFVFIELEMLQVQNDIPVGGHIKNRLDELFVSEHKKRNRFLLNFSVIFYKKDRNWYNQPIVQVAALFVLLVTVYMTLKLSPKDDIRIANNEVTENRSQKINKKKYVRSKTKSEPVRGVKGNSQPKIVIKEMPVILNNDSMSDTYETEERMVLEQSQMEYQHVDLNAVLAFTNLGTAVQYSSEIDDVTLSMEKHLVGNDDAFQVKPMSIDLLDVLHTIY